MLRRLWNSACKKYPHAWRMSVPLFKLSTVPTMMVSSSAFSVSSDIVKKKESFVVHGQRWNNQDELVPCQLNFSQASSPPTFYVYMGRDVWAKCKAAKDAKFFDTQYPEVSYITALQVVGFVDHKGHSLPDQSPRKYDNSQWKVGGVYTSTYSPNREFKEDEVNVDQLSWHVSRQPGHTYLSHAISRAYVSIVAPLVEESLKMPAKLAHIRQLLDDDDCDGVSQGLSKVMMHTQKMQNIQSLNKP